jgi:hypothetical protein
MGVSCWPRGVLEGGGRDVAPAGDSLFFASPKKSKQKKGDPAVRVPPLRCGQPAMLVRGVRRVTHCAAAQLRSDKRGESVHAAGVSCGTPATPRPVLLGTHRREPETAARAFAALGPVSRAQATRAAKARPSAAMARVAARLSTPCWLRPAAGVPRSAAQGSQTGGRLLFGDFLLARQEKVTAPPGAHPGSRPSHKHAECFQIDS